MVTGYFSKFLGALVALIALRAMAAAGPSDPYIWLEQVDSPRAKAWVAAENAKTLGVLEKDPRYAGIYSDSLALAEDKDRIPAPTMLNGAVYNFWQDAQHVRGIWRRTTLDNYQAAQPQWTTVLDLDALALAEKANWFLKETTCAEPAQLHCMLSLSDGGEDAVTVREFDLKSDTFAGSGFVLPKGKQRVAWEDENSLLVSREWNPHELTTSGYPFVLKRLGRGQPLSAAREIFRGAATDGGYGVTPEVLHDGEGHSAVLIIRPLTTFEAENYLVTAGRVARLALPGKVDIQSLVAGNLIIKLAEQWVAGGKTFATGSLVGVVLTEAAADPAHLKPFLLYSPGPRESVATAVATRDDLIVTTLENVRGRAFSLHPQPGREWKRTPIAVPDNATVETEDVDIHSNHAFISVTGFIQPSSLLLLDAASGRLQQVKALPPKFDASHLQVEQFEAASSDGTRIPYFVVHPRGMKLDGSNPTILNAYGGFQISETPYYSAPIGKLWLEKGGVFALANIRGGGEFGPAWHEAGLKTHRQLIYDDFSAVARDLIARKITSPRRLGIQGGSNGGLLMGVQFTQHPELWNAVDIMVPLLDMLRFEQIAAGTSWTGEYGSVSNPDEAAFLGHISPYANIHKGTKYPEAFIWTTTKDDRVGPQHARKFAARLGEYGIPYLFYEVTEGGHGAGANLKEKARTKALEMTYFTRKLVD